MGWQCNGLIDFGTNSILRIGGCWKNRTGYLSYSLGTIDVAAVRVKRGFANWYEDLTPWYEETPRNLAHWRFTGTNGATANKVIYNSFATNLTYTACVDRRTESGWWDTNLRTDGSFTNKVWAPYLSAEKGTAKRLANTSGFSSFVNGTSATPQLRVQNLPMYLVGDFTLEFIVNSETLPKDAYKQPAYCFMMAPEGVSRQFTLANQQDQFVIGYRGVDSKSTSIYCGSVGLQRQTWQHVAVVRDRSAGTIKVYVGGELKVTKTLASDAQVWSGDATNYAYTQLMSNAMHGHQNSYSGLVDEIRFTRAVLEPKDFLKARQSEGGTTILLH